MIRCPTSPSKVPRTIHLLYHQDAHYDSVRLASDYGSGPAGEILLDGVENMDDGSCESKVKVLVQNTGCDEDTAVEQLERSRYDVDAAVESILAQQQDERCDHAATGDTDQSGTIEEDSECKTSRPVDAGAPGAKGSRADKISAKKPSRNRPCPCGSGMKYKACCKKKGGSANQAKAVPDSGEEETTAGAKIKVLVI